MKVLLVSSKTMSVDQSQTFADATTPQFTEQASRLNEILRNKSLRQLKSLMHVSDNLARQSSEKIQDWKPSGGTPAWYAFVGDVYRGLQIELFDEEMLVFAQNHCFTISGLYGLLRPLDLIQPYRLELGYSLKSKGFKNLYDFWGGSIAAQFPTDEPLVSLASEEYIKVIRPYVSVGQIITPWFYQIKNGKVEFHAVHAKTARGMMARWICKNKITDESKLVSFSEDRYTYSAELTEPNAPAFVREFIPVAELRKRQAS